MITIQEFIARLDATPFSETAKQEIRTMLLSEPVLTPALHAKVIERLEREIDEELEEVEVDPAEEEALEKEVEAQLDLIEKNATEAVEKTEAQIREIDEMSRRIDILERLHSKQP